MATFLPAPSSDSGYHIAPKYWQDESNEPKLDGLTIPHDKATMFWCKIFKVPDLRTKHHIVGYRPMLDSRPIRNGRPAVVKDATSPVHHMVLYECVDDGDRMSWNEWSESPGAYGPARPKEWASCTTPVAAWAMGSKGEFLPENVGIPLGESSGVSYYMLEVHYDNSALHEVLDSSGIRVHFTSELRRHDAGVLGLGVGVSALHVIPPKQLQYRTAGICSAECSRKMLPTDGVTIVSAQLHAHGTARKISLKHIRGNNELRPITQENAYDARYQQSRMVPGGRQFMPGDILVTECTYDSTARDKPILGGYSAIQEMCLSFVVYYPRTDLAGCYSMTPVKEFFETFGIREFYGIDMLQVENMFLSSGSLDNFEPLEFDIMQHNEDTAMQGDDQGVGLLKELLIKEPFEFRNKSFIAHLNEMPWTEPLLTEQIEKTLYSGTHMTFCKKRDDSWGAPIEIQNFPNYTALVSNETVQKSCHFLKVSLPSTTRSTDAGHILNFSFWSLLIPSMLMILAR
ncbi:MOXD1 homolog 1 [Eumeta japonica]|uniref:MOXD1 homolog 1 n=1 Tax=Eumeta variegata TaxID=151549 RepID=A0A4C1VMJ6_EUMVA|nr:MOXD1 homolog 1 [Eumeta japonica]